MSSPSRLASLGGRALADVFAAHRSEFLAITRRASRRFVDDDMGGLRADTVERIDLYRASIDEAMGHLRDSLRDRLHDRTIWSSMKAVYSALICDRDDRELAETFFNSVSRKVFTTFGVDPLIEFVDSDFSMAAVEQSVPVHRTFAGADRAESILRRIFDAYDMSFGDEEEACAAIATRLEERLNEAGGILHVDRVEVLDAPLFRGPRVHLVTRVFSGIHVIPMVLVGCRTDDGARIEAVLLHEQDVSILFSFTRAYFHIDAPRPFEVVRFLRSILPRKRVAELYNAIGCDKHGKTEFYRDLRGQLRSSTQRLDFAPGTPGLVMAAFVLPGYDAVFKVIRDRARPPKVTNRDKVMGKYRFVQRHDRAGRLVEAQDFEYLAFRRERFSEALLDELATSCSDSVRLDDDVVVIRHLYVERQVVPLNIYLRSAGEAASRSVIIDLGYAIKDLGFTNVFPGDLLTKNFGVTRNGRVVFYDYDELVLLSECNFRRVPPPRDEFDEMASDPWYVVGENDIFPEELRTFIGVPRRWMQDFESHHADLFSPEFWWSLQAAVAEGAGPEVQPFRTHCLL